MDSLGRELQAMALIPKVVRAVIRKFQFSEQELERVLSEAEGWAQWAKEVMTQRII
jgi:hypothetical protein